MVRTDISLEQQLVQAVHAAYECGLTHNRAEEHVLNTFVVFESIERNLIEQFEQIQGEGVKTVKFYEPDNQMGWSAWRMTQPLNDTFKPLFKRYKLWRSPLNQGL